MQSGLISDLRQDDSIIEAMMSAGLTVQLTENNQSSIAKALTWYNSRIREKQETIEQFWQGAEELGLQKLLIQYPGMPVTTTFILLLLL